MAYIKNSLLDPSIEIIGKDIWINTVKQKSRSLQ